MKILRHISARRWTVFAPAYREEVPRFISFLSLVRYSLSVTANILTVLGAANAAGKVLRKVIALKNVPDILLALNNDIAELHHTV